MYITNYESPDCVLNQVIINYPKIVIYDDKDKQFFINDDNIINYLSTIENASFSLRFSLNEKKLIKTLIILTFNQSTDSIATILSPFVKQNLFMNNSIIFPNSAEEHDIIINDYPKFIYKNDPHSYIFNNSFFLTDFKLYKVFDKILIESINNNIRLDYQINISHKKLSSDSIRDLKKNIIRINEESDIPEKIKDIESYIINKIISSDIIFEEFLSTDTIDNSRHLNALLAKIYKDDNNNEFFDAPDFSFTDSDNYSEMITLGLNSGFNNQNNSIYKEYYFENKNNLFSFFFKGKEYASLLNTLNNVELYKNSEKEYSLKEIEKKLTILENKIDSISEKIYCDELKKAISIAKVDPPFSLAKSRNILETIILDIYRKKIDEKKSKPLFNMIEELLTIKDLFPKAISVYLNTIRIMGNLIVHAQDDKATISEYDIEIILLMTMNLVEWYVLNFQKI